MAAISKKEANSVEKHSLSSFEGKREARIVFNAQERTKRKYRVVNVRSREGNISSANSVIHGENPVSVSENSGNKKPVKNTANENRQAYRRTENRFHDTVHQPESAVQESEKIISPEMAQRMKFAAYLQEQDNEKIKINTAQTFHYDTKDHSESITEKPSDRSIVAENSEQKPYENKYVSQTSDSIIPEAKKVISPEMAQRMKRAAYLDNLNKDKIKTNTARAEMSVVSGDVETRSQSDVTEADSGYERKKIYENKYLSETADSVIPEAKKVISPEMALRMKRAEFLAQKNEEALRLNRVTVIDSDEKQDTAHGEQAEYSEEEQNVPVEHLEETEENPTESSGSGSSENTAFDTYNDDVRAYKAKNAYGKFIQKQKKNACNSGIDSLAETVQTVGEISRGEAGRVIANAVIGGVAGESLQGTINGVETVVRTVSDSNSVGGTVLDVSSVLAAVEAKKTVKKLAETDLKKQKRVDERMKNHGNRFGIGSDHKNEVEKDKNEKIKNSREISRQESETAAGKQGSSKVGNSHRLREEKQDYAKKQKSKEIRNKRKDLFVKENKKLAGTVYSTAGKESLAKTAVKKKAVSLIMGGGAVTAVIPILLAVLVYILISAFFGWLSPFSYSLAGDEADPGTGLPTERNAQTKAEIIDGYTLMVKNYLDVTQAYYYLNYGDWYGGTYQYESLELDFGTFFSDYCRNTVDEIRAYYQPLIDNASSPAQAMAISQAMGQAISQALANAQQAALEEYEQLTSALDDVFTPMEHRQHYEVEVTGGGNGTDDSVDFHDKPIPGTNFFGNVEINSELSAEELLAYIALYKSMLTINPDEAEGDSEIELNITPQDIMDFFEETGFVSITAEVTHDNLCAGQNCKRSLIGDASNGYSWEYYCDGDHDNLTGEIGSCLTADELLDKIIELTGAEDNGIDSEQGHELIDSYIDMFKKELDIDESDFRKFGASDNEKAQEFYQLLITGELSNADLWEVDTPITEAE